MSDKTTIGEIDADGVQEIHVGADTAVHIYGPCEMAFVHSGAPEPPVEPIPEPEPLHRFIFKGEPDWTGKQRAFFKWMREWEFDRVMFTKHYHLDPENPPEVPFGFEIKTPPRNVTDGLQVSAQFQSDMAAVVFWYETRPVVPFTWVGLDVENTKRDPARTMHWLRGIRNRCPGLHIYTGPIGFGDADRLDVLVEKLADYDGIIDYRAVMYASRYVDDLASDAAHQIAQALYLEARCPHILGNVYVGPQPLNGHALGGGAAFEYCPADLYGGATDMSSYASGGITGWSMDRLFSVTSGGVMDNDARELLELLRITNRNHRNLRIFDVNRVKPPDDDTANRKYETALCRVVQKAGMVPRLVDSGGWTFTDIPDDYGTCLRKMWSSKDRTSAVRARVKEIEDGYAKALREEVE